jgi:hypothetical protein
MFAIAFLIAGDTPDTDASGEKVIDHYDKAGKYYVALIALFIAALAFTWFSAYLRSVLTERAGAPSWLGSVIHGGAVVYTVGLTIFGITTFSLLDAADKELAGAAQTLNVLDNDNFFPTVVGLSALALGVAWAVLSSRPRPLPTWLGWVALAIGVISILGPLGFIAFLAFPLWVLAVGIVLFRQAPQPIAGTAAV